MRKALHQDVVKRLEDIVGENHVLTTEDALEKYSRDETIGLQAWPDVVVRTRSADDISRIMKLASEHSDTLHLGDTLEMLKCNGADP